MNTKITSMVAGAVALLIASPAFALSVGARVNVGLNGTSASSSATLETRIDNAKNRANQEIERRTNALNEQNAKVQASTKISAEAKASIASTISSEISALASLKAKIDAETDMTALKTDIKSITEDYRIFMLVIPQGRIIVAADHIQTAASTFASFATKLEARISQAQGAGKDVSSISAKLSDMKAKIADAQTQAQAAVSLAVNLKPDAGVSATAQANAAALKSAHADIKAALKDLQAAHEDARAIVKGLKDLGVSASSTTSVSTQ